MALLNGNQYCKTAATKDRIEQTNTVALGINRRVNMMMIIMVNRIELTSKLVLL